MIQKYYLVNQLSYEDNQTFGQHNSQAASQIHDVKFHF